MFVGRAQPAYDSFKEGLCTLGVLDSILHYPQVMREAFCFKPDTLTVTDFDDMFSVTRACEGSNRREVENLVLSHWQDLMQDYEEESAEITLSDILFFVSGCKTLPPRDFHVKYHFCMNLMRNQEYFLDFLRQVHVLVPFIFLYFIKLMKTLRKL